MFVFFYLAFHSGSFFLAAAGMLHVMMSFPLAFVIYRHVFGIVPFYPLAFLSIYVILARPPPLVPVGTLLHGEKGYYTGTRVRASRYEIR